MSDINYNDVVDMIRNLGRVEEKMDAYERRLGAKDIEIERLRAECVRLDAKWRDWESAHQAQKERADFAEQRIEVLENHLEAWSRATDAELISRPKIDAAWEQQIEPDQYAPLLRSDLLGIVWCDECGGAGIVREHERGYEDGVEDTCPRCGGHGWTMRGGGG